MIRVGFLPLFRHRRLLLKLVEVQFIISLYWQMNGPKFLFPEAWLW